MATWYDGKVIEIKDISPTTKHFLLEVPELEQIDFRAGQFITMDLPIHEKRLKRWRSYSIANPPNGKNTIELCIVYLEGGLASEYLFKELQLHDTIKFKGPVGVFVLPEKLEDSVVLICTGTGVAPFRSMIYDLIQKQKLPKHLHLIFGTRLQENILYREEFEALQLKYPEFKYTVTLSRDKNWKGATGYVHAIYESEYAKQPSTKFYLCGWQTMIDEANVRLQKMGVPTSNIVYELYG